MPRPAVLNCAVLCRRSIVCRPASAVPRRRVPLCRHSQSAVRNKEYLPYLLPDVLVLNLNPLCYSSRYRRPVEESHIGYRSTQEHEGGRGDGRFSVFYAKCRCFSKLPNLTCFIKLASYLPLQAISFLVYRGSLDDCDLKRCFHNDQSIRFIQTDMDFPLATTLQHRTLFHVLLGKFICFNKNK